MGLFRAGPSKAELEMTALIAEAIRRSVGVTVTDGQLAVGLAMSDQIEGRRVRRATKTIDAVNIGLHTRRDRSLAAALAVFLYAGTGRRVSVMTADDAGAREDAELYRAINETLGGLASIGLLEPGPNASKREAALQRDLMIGSVEEFTRAMSPVYVHATVLRPGPGDGGRVPSGPRIACLPDL